MNGAADPHGLHEKGARGEAELPRPGSEPAVQLPSGPGHRCCRLAGYQPGQRQGWGDGVQPLWASLLLSVLPELK